MGQFRINPKGGVEVPETIRHQEFAKKLWEFAKYKYGVQPGKEKERLTTQRGTQGPDQAGVS